MRRYEAYKNSGVAWLGEIPAGWEMRRLKNCIVSRNAGAWGTDEQNNENDIICLRVADFDYENFIFRDCENFTIRNYDAEVIKKLLLSKDDILIEKSGGGEKTPVGRAVIFDKNYRAVFANFMERIRTQRDISPKYFLYAWSVLYGSRYITRYIKQTTGIQNLDVTSLFIHENFPLPPLPEQNTIAKFLDDKVSQIEKLISIRQRQIIDLSDLKKAIINKAVTKGLKSGAKMKDSGFLWLGEIPAGWEVAPIKRLFTLQTGATPDTSKPEFWDGSILWVTPSDFQTEQKYISGGKKTITQAGYNSCGTKLAPKGSVIFSKRAPIGKVAITSEELCTNQGCISCINRGYVSAEYFYYLLSSLPDVFNALGNGATFKEISASDFGNFRVLVPPADEQNEIAAYLDKKCSQINRAITNTQQQISELGELKARLISDAVTGKIDVR